MLPILLIKLVNINLNHCKVPYADNEIDSEIKFMSTGSNNHLFKGGLISERFSRWLISSKKCAKHYPEHLIFRLIEVGIVIWHLFWEIGAEVKKLSEIEPPLASFTSHFHGKFHLFFEP